MREKRLWVQINRRSAAEPIDFVRCSSLVADLFTFKLPPIIVKGIRKVNIDFADHDDALLIGGLDSILTIVETFPFDLFDTADLHGKTALLADRAYKCLMLVYQHLNLDVEQLKIGYKKILDDDFVLTHILFGGPKQNRNRSIKATVKADFLIDYTSVNIIFLNKNDIVINEIPLFKTIPGWLFYSLLLKTCKWIDGETFEMANGSKEINFRVNINRQISMHYLPVNRDVDGIKEEIRFLTLERSFDL